jgi:hypothetical protein
LDKRRNAGEALDTTFLSCANPRKLQEICDSIGPEDTDGVFRKMAEALPLPLRRRGCPDARQRCQLREHLRRPLKTPI